MPNDTIYIGVPYNTKNYKRCVLELKQTNFHLIRGEFGVGMLPGGSDYHLAIGAELAEGQWPAISNLTTLY